MTDLTELQAAQCVLGAADAAAMHWNVAIYGTGWMHVTSQGICVYSPGEGPCLDFSPML